MHGKVIQNEKGYLCRHIISSCADPEGGGAGVRTPPPGKSQNVGFLSNTCPDYKATKPTFTVWPSSTRQRDASLHYVPAATAITFQATVDETNGVIVAQRNIKSKVVSHENIVSEFATKSFPATILKIGMRDLHVSAALELPTSSSGCLVPDLRHRCSQNNNNNNKQFSHVFHGSHRRLLKKLKATSNGMSRIRTLPSDFPAKPSNL